MAHFCSWHIQENRRKHQHCLSIRIWIYSGRRFKPLITLQTFNV
jgi:hypothetical protein